MKNQIIAFVISLFAFNFSVSAESFSLVVTKKVEPVCLITLNETDNNNEFFDKSFEFSIESNADSEVKYEIESETRVNGEMISPMMVNWMETFNEGETVYSQGHITKDIKVFERSTLTVFPRLSAKANFAAGEIQTKATITFSCTPKA